MCDVLLYSVVLTPEQQGIARVTGRCNARRLLVLGFGVGGLGFGVWDLGFRAEDLGCLSFCFQVLGLGLGF